MLVALWHRISAYHQLMFYCICGGSGVLADMGIYSALLLFDVNYQLANAAGYGGGTLLSFFLNRHFTFKTYDRTASRLATFFLVAMIGFACSWALLWCLVSLAGWHPLAAKVATLFVVLAIQFFLNKSITFK